jgi:branched-chain amino acid transport system permease protein
MLFVLPIVATLMDRPYYVGLGARVLIFAIAALSLDLILGFGGMVSFCQAIYLGIGAYAVGILSSYGFSNGFLHFGIAISASAFVALIIERSSALPAFTLS